MSFGAFIYHYQTCKHLQMLSNIFSSGFIKSIGPWEFAQAFFFSLHIVFLDKVDKYCCLGDFRCGLTTEHFGFFRDKPWIPDGKKHFIYWKFRITPKAFLFLLKCFLFLFSVYTRFSKTCKWPLSMHVYATHAVPNKQLKQSLFKVQHIQ